MLSLMLGAESPPLLLASSCAFLWVEPKRTVKIVVRAMLLLALWMTTEVPRTEVLPAEPMKTRAGWAQDFTPLPTDLSRQCWVRSSNLSTPATVGGSRRLEYLHVRPPPVLSWIDIVLKPEVLLCMVVAASVRATKDVFCFE